MKEIKLMMPDEQNLPDTPSSLIRFIDQINDHSQEACCVVLVTCPSFDVARDISRAVVSAKRVACVNLIPGVTSVYEWEGAVFEESEVLLVMKTQEQHLDALYQHLKSIHPYTVPEFVVLPFLAGSEPYINWLRNVTR